MEAPLESPQALIWERDHVERVVARYCRLLVRAEEDGGVSLQNEVRQLEDRLLLNSKALSYNQVEMAPPDSGSGKSPAQSSEAAYLRAVGAIGDSS